MRNIDAKVKSTSVVTMALTCSSMEYVKAEMSESGKSLTGTKQKRLKTVKNDYLG